MRNNLTSLPYRGNLPNASLGFAFGMGVGYHTTQPLRPVWRTTLDYGVSSWLIDHSPHRDKSYLLLLILAYHADKNGQCFPSVPRLARECRFSQRTVQRILKLLESDGSIVIHRRVRQSSIYVVTLGCHSYVTMMVSEECHHDGVRGVSPQVALEVASEETSKKQDAPRPEPPLSHVEIKNIKDKLKNLNPMPRRVNYKKEAEKQKEAMRKAGYLQ